MRTVNQYVRTQTSEQEATFGVTLSCTSGKGTVTVRKKMIVNAHLLVASKRAKPRGEYVPSH